MKIADEMVEAATIAFMACGGPVETSMRAALEAAMGVGTGKESLQVAPEAGNSVSASGDERARFEAWAKAEGLQAHIYSVNDMYSHPVTRGAWIAWQHLAAREPVGGRVPEVMDRCIRELQSFIDVAHDYDLDEMAVQALQTAIESMELRKQPTQPHEPKVDLGQFRQPLESWKRKRERSLRNAIEAGKHQDLVHGLRRNLEDAERLLALIDGEEKTNA